MIFGFSGYSRPDYYGSGWTREQREVFGRVCINCGFVNGVHSIEARCPDHRPKDEANGYFPPPGWELRDATGRLLAAIRDLKKVAELS
jgi:hypothetical protein